MSNLIIRLLCYPETGRREITAALSSGEDTVPFEHEQQHRSLVDRLFHGGTLRLAREGCVVVERAEDMLPVFLGGG